MDLSFISFLMSVICSVATYLIFSNTGLTNPSTSFLYFVLPALFLVDVCYRIFKFKTTRGRLPKQMFPQWAIWMLYVTICEIVLSVNILSGLFAQGFSLFATTLILPMIMALVIIPIRYYIKKFAIVKYWR